MYIPTESQLRAAGLLKAEAASSQAPEDPPPLRLARHIEAMAADAYLSGHPEWAVLVEEARGALGKETEIDRLREENAKLRAALDNLGEG